MRTHTYSTQLQTAQLHTRHVTLIKMLGVVLSCQAVPFKNPQLSVLSPVGSPNAFQVHHRFRKSFELTSVDRHDHSGSLDQQLIAAGDHVSAAAHALATQAQAATGSHLKLPAAALKSQQPNQPQAPDSVTSPTQATPATGAATPNFQAYVAHIHSELGDGEGVTALLARSRALGTSGHVIAVEEEEDLSLAHLMERPASPTTRLRRDTYGATLDFIEALCEASTNLTCYPQVCAGGCNLRMPDHVCCTCLAYVGMGMPPSCHL